MKISTDIIKASAVVYLSVVFRHNLATDGCKSQDLHNLRQLQFHSLKYPLRKISTYAVEVTVFVVTEYSPLGHKFCNITYFGGM